MQQRSLRHGIHVDMHDDHDDDDDGGDVDDG